MRNLFAVVGLVGILAANASATNLNVTIKSGGSSSVQVQPSAVVQYEVEGVLNDSLNEGLALFGFDLSFTGGALQQANNPIVNPMLNFKNNAGINNPAGFGGTIIGNNLIQVGGGQNTIKNDATNAPFPVGTVITGVAQPGSPVVLVAGSLTAPAAPGNYTLSLTNLFANVIKDGEDGTIFWATQAANPGTITNLSIMVSAGNNPVIVSSNPPNNAIDARQPVDPVSGDPSVGFNSIVLNLDSSGAGLVPGSFSISTNPVGSTPTIMSVVPAGNTATVNLNATIPVFAWTTITLNGSNTRIGYLPADVNNDKVSNANDILALINHLNNVVVLQTYQTDINRDSTINANDILREIDLLNGAGIFDPFLGLTLPN